MCSLDRIMPSDVKYTRELMGATARASDPKCSVGAIAKTVFVAKIYAVALLVMCALNTLTSPLIGILDSLSNVLKLEFNEALQSLVQGIVDMFRSALAVVYVASALLVSFVYCPVFQHFINGCN